jgi:hypothetical protein
MGVATVAGRMKTEQVVLEFLYKVAELIIQSRVTFESDLDSRRAARRARVRPCMETKTGV